MAAHSSTLAWSIPRTEEPSGLWSIRSQDLDTTEATQDGRVMVERSDRMWSTEEGNGKPLQYSCLENPMNSIKRQKDMTLKDKLPRLEE